MPSANILKVLMASAEIAPLAKVGGLGDVVGSLPKELFKLGVDVRLIMPKYSCINAKRFGLKKIFENIQVPTHSLLTSIDLWEAKLPDSEVVIYLIDHPKFTTKEIYTADNIERFMLFSWCCIFILPVIDFTPDIIHSHDFHTAFISDLLKVSPYPKFKDIKTILTIHNLYFQGITDQYALAIPGLNRRSLPSIARDLQDGDLNFMVQGILNADKITTVSPTYAQEILDKPQGEGLEHVLKKRKRDLSGILNGIDTQNFDPVHDKMIQTNYSWKNLDQKTTNKLYLQKILKLPKNKKAPLIGMISRLYKQKGFDLISEVVVKQILHDFPKTQFVILGQGDKLYEKSLKFLAKRFPANFRITLGFNLKLAQQIYAGSDIFLMPSLFEPCGLGQMIAMRYGSIPVVRKTGGLADTVDKSVGFSFAELSEQALLSCLHNALDTYYNKPHIWKNLQANAMKKDFSWKKSAQKYLQLYCAMLKKDYQPKPQLYDLNLRPL
jgi:starch synthase